MKSVIKAISFLIILVSLLLGASVLLILHVHPPALAKGDPSLTTIIQCGAFGLLGASTAAARKFYQALITDETEQSRIPAGAPRLTWGTGWLAYFFFRPVIGAVLGASLYTLCKFGVEVLVRPELLDFSNQGKSLLKGMAFLAGLTTSNLLDSLASLGSALFRRRSLTG